MVIQVLVALAICGLLAAVYLVRDRLWGWMIRTALKLMAWAEAQKKLGFAMRLQRGSSPVDAVLALSLAGVIAIIMGIVLMYLLPQLQTAGTPILTDTSTVTDSTTKFVIHLWFWLPFLAVGLGIFISLIVYAVHAATNGGNGGRR